MYIILYLSVVELMYGFSDNVLYFKKLYNFFFMNVYLYNVCVVWFIYVFFEILYFMRIMGNNFCLFKNLKGCCGLLFLFNLVFSSF